MQESVPGQPGGAEPHHGGAQESSEARVRQDLRARHLNAGRHNAKAGANSSDDANANAATNDSGEPGSADDANATTGAVADEANAPDRTAATPASSGTAPDRTAATPASSSTAPDPKAGAHARSGTATERLGRQAWAWIKELLIIIVIAVVLSFLIKTFLFRAFFIPSGSMENTLQIQDRIFVNLLVPEPISIKRGDVVVFKDTQGWLKSEPASDGPIGWVGDVATFIGLAPDNSQQHLVKRVIGLPGDRVMCCSADGKLTVNGQPITEPYLFPGAAPSDTPFDVTVPEGHLWVMGDHRNNSQDSRFHDSTNHTGFVPVADVEGRAVVVAWPLTHWGILGNYPDVFTDVPDPASSSVGSQQHVPAGQ